MDLRAQLTASGLPDDVSVSARWRTTEGPRSLADITLTVAVSTRAKAVTEALAAAFANSARSTGLLRSLSYRSRWKE